MEENQSTSALLGVHPMRNISKADKLCASHLPLQQTIMHTQLARAMAFHPSRGRHLISEDEIEWCIQHAPANLDAEPSTLVPLWMIHTLRNQHIKMVMVSTGKGVVEE